jgi:predicted nuclease with TOPRIM domain
MNDATILGASAIVALLALVTAAVAWVSKIRSDRQHRLAFEEASRTRDKQIQALEQQVDFLRQLEAVKFVERYIATRRGLQQRLDRLVADVEAGHAREREIEREIRELSQTDEERDGDVQKLRAELSRNQQEAHRLEQAIDAVYSIGEIQVDDVRREVARRRRLAVELKGRIERLGLDSEAKVAEIARLRAELEAGRETMDSLKRELDLTRSAGPIVDGLLGIDEELADRVDDIDHNLAQAGLDLGSGADAETVGHFLAVVERERSQRGRLLGAGAGAPAPAAANDEDRDVPAALERAVADRVAPGARADGADAPEAYERVAPTVERAAPAAPGGAEPEEEEQDPWDAVTSGAGNGAHRDAPAPARPERRPVAVPGPVIAESTPAEENRPEEEPPEPRVWY